MPCLGPSDILRLNPAIDNDRQEEKGTDNNGCGTSGKGSPLDIDDGETP